MEKAKAKLKVEFGKVTFLQKTGNDVVKSVMSEEAANRILKERLTVIDDEFKGFPIHAGEFYFEGIVSKRK